ncbi:MAG: ferrous iron transport protein B [Ignavibacteria bacterium]|nr:ferrous iron transport protein B [Ignavibacteria bacterium]
MPVSSLNSQKQKTSLVTLVGPPNSGKSTLYNLLSGSKAKTVNYPGSTIEYSISRFLKHFDVQAALVDSPGIVSLMPDSPEEKLSIDYLFSHPKYGSPDLIVITADASQLSRHLFLVQQVIDTNAKVIVALTMIDLLNKKGYDISVNRLNQLLKCDVIPVNGRNGKGLDNLIDSIKKNLKKKKSKVIYNYKNDYGTKLVDIYKTTEFIENEVLYPIGEGAKQKTADNDLLYDELKIKSDIIKIKPDERTLKLDRLFLNKYWGILIFLLIMASVFTSIFWLAAPLMDIVDLLFTTLSNNVTTLFGETWFSNLLSDGIITGVGSVLIFIPQIMILFLLLGFLEDTGYLARGAMLVDRPLSKIGLNGKSFVPMLSGFACAIPAIMATRTIKNKKERFLTIFIIPLMSCSARLPVYALLLAFLLHGSPFLSGITLALIYLFSITSSLIIAGIINKYQSKIIKVKDSSSFILELPTYRLPNIKNVIRNTITNANHYVKRAGPIIIIFSLVIWFLTYFPNSNPVITNSGDLSKKEVLELKSSERLTNSYASMIGNFIEPVMKPLGMDWRIGVSIITTFAAREVFVSSMAMIFKVTDTEGDLRTSIVDAMKNAKIKDTNKKLFTTSTVIGLIVFFVFALQCISTIAVSKKETGGWRLPILQLVIFTTMAYVLTFITVNGLKLFGVE